MASFVKRVSASGETSWLVTIRLRGHPTTCQTFQRKTDAREWATKTETDMREGRYGRTAEAKRHTLSDLIDRYLREGFQHKPDSYSNQKTQLEWWRAKLGHYALIDITPARIAECKAKLLSETTYRGTARAPSTANRYLAALSDAFTDAAKEWHWTSVNPVQGVKKLSEPRGRTRFLSDVEREALISACRESSLPELLPVVLIALTTGARHGEIMGATWKDVDLRRGLLILRDTKNGDTRSVPLLGEPLEILKERSKVRRLDTDLLFPRIDGEKSISIREAFDAVLKKAAIEDFRFHDLRHTAASYLAMSGATLAEIASVLGHRTLAMVKRYAHLTDQHTAGILTRMHQKYFDRGAS